MDNFLKKTAIIGAAGKMGRGIALLILQEIACELARSNDEYRLTLIDSDESTLFALKESLRIQLTKYAEKNINKLRGYYSANKSLISNQEMIDYFVQKGIDSLQCGCDVHLASGSTLILEAAVEDIELKCQLLKQLKAISAPNAIFLTNTSSIPIALLNSQCGLSGRIAGLHFYNPPPIQKVVEVVFLQPTDPEVKQLVMHLVQRLGKKAAHSHDVAGFIGNGFLIRECNYACQQVRSLGKSYPITQAIAMVNRVTESFLIRPMGIFQLIDFVGIDVIQRIGKIMSAYLPLLHLDLWLVEEMVKQGILGGQRSDGSQKDGFFRYQEHRPVAIYNLDRGEYEPLLSLQEILGMPPQGHQSWKKMLTEQTEQRQEKLKNYFVALKKDSTLGSELARDYLAHSAQIVKQLVDDKVIDDIKEAYTVLENGFFHLYRPGDVG